MREAEEDISIGIDVDGTLTEDKVDRDMFTLSSREVETRMSNLSPKKGIDVLLDSDLDIHIITGRQEKFRYVTVDWLNMYGIPYKDLTMFPDDFYEKNGYDVPRYAGLKLDIHVRKNIHMSLDDNEHVVDMLNKFGISSCKVDNNFREAFERVLELRKDNTNNMRSKANNRRV